MVYKKRLEELRERVGLTMSEAGKLIGIDAGTYCHYEKEDLIIPLKHLNTLCNYFEVSLDYMFGFTNVKCYDNLKQEISKTDVGNRLKLFRKHHKLTQVKLATILNTVHPVITNYEKGKNLIATPFLYTICQKYRVSADYLLGKIDEPKYLD